jgi:hypothetical protein
MRRLLMKASRRRTVKENFMNTKWLLLELLISGFFAIACLRARPEGIRDAATRPRDLLRLTGRLERLRRTRWQWSAMVLVIVCVRLQAGLPLIAELTAALQFVVFLALPVQERSPLAQKSRGLRGGTKRPFQRLGNARVN